MGEIFQDGYVASDPEPLYEHQHGTNSQWTMKDIPPLFFSLQGPLGLGPFWLCLLVLGLVMLVGILQENSVPPTLSPSVL